MKACSFYRCRERLRLGLEAEAKLDSAGETGCTISLSEIRASQVSVKLIPQSVPVPEIEKLGAELEVELLTYRNAL